MAHSAPRRAAPHVRVQYGGRRPGCWVGRGAAEADCAAAEAGAAWPRGVRDPHRAIHTTKASL
eukprot:230511-Chlamydomonas_euryale.AAC.2